jgi:hypothetical protein
VPRIERALPLTVYKLAKTYSTWFEDAPIPPAQLARELVVTTIRIPPDAIDVTIHADHPYCTGHVVEIALTMTGAVRHAGLLG